MKNLKKVLSLVLALAMALSLMTVAFAKDASDYNDYDKVTNKEAVNVMTALGIIDGMGGGFNPTGNVTRAQMAKMITIICLGDVDPTAFLGTTTDLKDINGHWAEAYIKYCYSQGIISGKGNGIFDPNANVTSAEASKMLLTAIGYNSDVQGYTGPQWAINVTRDAQKDGLYNGVSVPANKALTRDEAAQMIYNAIDTGVVEATPHWDSSTGVTSYSYVKQANTDDLLHRTFNVTTTETTLDKTVYDSEKAEYTYTLGANVNGSADVTSAADYSNLFGMNVKVMWTTDKAGDTVIYGIYPNKSAVVTSAAYHTVENGDENGEIKIGGTTYKLDNTGAKNVTYTQYNTTTTDTPAAYETVDFIDMDGDGKIDKGIYVPFTVKEVTYVGAKSYTYADPGTGANAVNKNFDDTGVSVYNGIAKDDFVMVVPAANSAKSVIEITKLTKQTGKVTSTKGTDEVQIDGTWYKVASNSGMLGNEYDFVAVNGYIAYSDGATTTTAIEDYVVVTGYQAKVGFQKNDQIQILRSNGQTEIVDAEDGYSASNIGNMYILADADDDDLYELAAVETTDGADADKSSGFDGYKASATYSKTAGKAGTISGMSIADDAVVFVNDSGKYKVITGADLAKVNTATVTHAYYNTNKSTGFNTVALAYVSSALTSTSDMLYGYVTADVTTGQNADKDTVDTITFWGANGAETLVTDKDNDGKLAKGDYFSYKLDANGNMTDITEITVAASAQAVTAWDGTYMTFDGVGGTFEVDEDTVIIYVDSENKTGIEGGTIALAGKNAGGTYVENVVAVAYGVGSSDYTLDILFVDISNEIQ